MQTLLVGQIGSAAVHGAELWYLAEETFGQQAAIGAVCPVVVQDQDRAPAGKAGKLVLRRVYWPIAYSGQCVIKVTPVVDFDWFGPATVKSFAQPAKRRVAVIEAECGNIGTFVAARIEVLTYSGRIEIFTPEYGIQVKAEVAMDVAGPD